MKKTVQKLLSLLLAVTLLASAVPILTGFAADNTPVVYVFGKQDIYKTDENGNRVELFGDGDYLNALLDGAVPMIAKGALTGDWDEYVDHALGVLLPAFEGFAMRPDGTLPEGTGINWSWSESSLRPDYHIGSHPVYIFRPDSRLSPMVIADQINDFVGAVKRRTGASRVMMLSRCEGTALASAYLYKYEKDDGVRDLEKLIFINSSVNGVGYVDAMMTGNVSIGADSAYRFLHNIDAYTKIFKETDTSLDAQTLSLISDVVEALHETYGINLTAAALNRMYGQLKDSFFAPLIRAYWGVSLSFVSCVNDHYEDYADYLFGERKDEYATLIAQADDFHYNVQLHEGELLQAAEAAGVPVNVIVEYGIQQYPVSEDSDMIGDYMISVEKQSFGAKTCKVNETLPESYRKARADAGFGDYLSPDRQIDASVGLFPDNTWYVRNLIHVFPGQLDRLMEEILRDGANVRTTSGGQFLNYKPEEPRFVKAEAVNDNDYHFENEEPTGVKNVVNRLIALLRRVIAYVKDIIAGIEGHAKGTLPPVE